MSNEHILYTTPVNSNDKENWNELDPFGLKKFDSDVIKFDRMMDFLSLHVSENRSVCQIKSSCISKQCKQKCGSKEEVYK